MILRRLVVAASVAAVVTAPGHAAPAQAADDAATINGVSITVDEFDQFASDLAEAGLTQFAPTEASRTLDGEAGRTLLTVLLMNEGRAQFLAEQGEEAPTESEIEDYYVALGADHPLQTLTGDSRVAVANDTIYTQRIDAIEVTDVEALRERYEARPASLGVYCATAVIVADQADAEAVAAAIAGGATAADAAATVDDADVTDWQCTPVSSVTDPVLHASIVDAQPGEAIGPVSTADGFAVLVIDTWDDAAPKLESFFLRLEEGGETSAGFVLYQGFLLDADIDVNPRYGRWDPATGSVVILGM